MGMQSDQAIQQNNHKNISADDQLSKSPNINIPIQRESSNSSDMQSSSPFHTTTQHSLNRSPQTGKYSADSNEEIPEDASSNRHYIKDTSTEGEDQLMS